MSLRYRLSHIPMPHPIVPLGGRFVRPRPLAAVRLFGPAGSALLDALVDSGADDTVFPEQVAAALGIDLTNAPSGTAAGVGGSPAALKYAEVLLRLDDGRERREWQAWVGFTSAKSQYPMLGFAGCLQFFDFQLFGAREEFELTVNALYPGT